MAKTLCSIEVPHLNLELVIDELKKHAPDIQIVMGSSFFVFFIVDTDSDMVALQLIYGDKIRIMRKETS